MLEIRELRMVVAIQEHGSLARAARVLGIAQPALTRSLAKLETRLRGPLFARSPRGVIATDLGRAVLADAEDILGRLARLDRFVADARGDQVRDLNVIAGAFSAESICLAAAGRMLGLYPRIRLRLISANWAEVPRALHAREAAFGVVNLFGFEPDPALEVEPLRPQPALFMVRPGHPLAGRDGTDIADVMAFPMLLVGRIPPAIQAAFAAAREEARARGALHPAFPAMVHESPTVALAALRHSDAVTPVPVALAERPLALGQVVALRWRAPWLSIHPAILRLRSRPLGETEQAFLDLLRDVDAEAEREALAWCAANGLPAECA